MPMGRVAVRDDIYEVNHRQGGDGGIELFHGYTYSGHPVRLRRGWRGLAIYRGRRACSTAPPKMAALFSPMCPRSGTPSAVKDAPLDRDDAGAVELHPCATARPCARVRRRRALFWNGCHIKFTGIPRSGADVRQRASPHRCENRGQACATRSRESRIDLVRASGPNAPAAGPSWGGPRGAVRAVWLTPATFRRRKRRRTRAKAPATWRLNETDDQS